ncbi:MAG: hypothetical protein HC808_11570 [Candidatus Competibacteraceae bacterium]|nr:hypothetical protein [Candidatus Competibacteraceae bacterium]
MESERIDVRKLERAAREQLRRTVVRLFNREHSQAFIARELGLRRATVAAWVGKARAGLDPQEGRRGWPLGVGRRLTAAQGARLRQEILERTPDQRQLRCVRKGS